jgi:hypothetical protein
VRVPPPDVLDVARGVLGDLDVERVLERVLESARELTGARYAAVGVLDESRTALARFVTTGVEEATRREIGSLPTGPIRATGPRRRHYRFSHMSSLAHDC